jgi:hypothetical protein
MVTLAAAPKAIVTATRRMSTYCIAEANAGAVMKVPAGATLPSSEAARYHRPCIATGSHVTTTARRSAALSGWL